MVFGGFLLLFVVALTGLIVIPEPGAHNPELDRKLRSNRKVLRARERWLAENLGGVSYGPYRGELLNSLRAVLLTEGAWNALAGQAGGSLGRLIDRKIRDELWDPRVDRAELISAVSSVGRDWQTAMGSLKMEPVSTRSL